MLDKLAELSRKPWPYVLASILVVVAVVGPALVSKDRAASPGSTAATPAAATASAPSPSSVPSSTLTAPAPVAATTTIGANTPEVDRPGDPANPGARYAGRPDLRDNDQERAVGGDPARLSGYSAWVMFATAETKGPDGKAGRFVKLTVRIVNRDDAAQTYKDLHWTLRRPDNVVVNTTYATPAFVAGATLPGNGEVYGELWFETPVDGRYWLAYRPDSSSARGVWLVTIPVERAA
ncbi:MAG: DUF4352 domain-containing protein [Acidimicrobiia bacterium]